MKIFRCFFFIIISLLISANWLYAQDRAPDPPEESVWDWFWEIFSFYGESADQQQSEIYPQYRDVTMQIPLSGKTRFKIGDDPEWKKPEYPDENWEKIQIPSDWENEGFHGYDGFAWYRISFDGNLLNTNNAHFLHLGFIDDVDATYLNGVLVGQSGQFLPKFSTAYNAFRKYFLPEALIDFEGKNVVAVRVFDKHANGGIVSGPIGIYSAKERFGLTQNFDGLWQFKVYDGQNYGDELLRDDNWETVVVPSFWDNFGYRTFDGIAWYRKRFNLNFKPEASKKYYLLVGRIDDFDATYLNGKKIGETNDGRSFGQSDSYRKLRAYPIPEGLLRTNKENTIAIKVKDIGLQGGLYEGPFGIIEESQLKTLFTLSR